MCSQKLAVLSGNGLNILRIDNGNCESYLSDESSIYEALFDSNGKYFCYCSNNGTFLVDLQNDNKILLNSSSRSRKICFSPKSTFVCVFALNNGSTNDDNVFIYQSQSGELFHSYKYSNSGSWAPQWSADEKMSIKILKSEVLVFSDSTFEKFNGKITIKGLEKAAISMSNNQYHIATYVKGTQGMPNMVKIFQHPNFRNPINNRSFFKATDVYLKWSPNGKYLLFLVHVEDTKTNYYGENSLYFMTAEQEGETALISMPKEDNYVHCVEWEPVTGDRFVATYGNPVSVAVFNSKCKLIQHIDAPNRNICQFSHCGQLLALVGVGNVRGSLQLWNFVNNKLIGEIDVPDINRVCWSGNDRYVASATVSPSLRVNNGIIIWSTGGELIADKPACSKLLGSPTEIYNVLWQPSPPTVAADNKHDHCRNIGSNATGAASFYFNSQCQKFREKQVPKTSTAYVPPHLRNRSAGGGDNDSTCVANGAVNQKIGQTTSGLKFTTTITDKQQQQQTQSSSGANKPKKKKNKTKAGSVAVINQA